MWKPRAGIECGEVAMPNRRVGGHDEVVKPLSGHCVASEKDLEQVRLNREKEKKAYQICLEKIRQHKWI